MLQIKDSIVINAPVDQVWRALAKLDDVENFVDSVKRSDYSTEQREGVGAARTCDVDGFGTLLETVTAWKEGETFTYEVEGMPPIVKGAQSTWRLERANRFQTRVMVTNKLETRFGFVGSLMEKIAMKPQITRLLRSALVSFKAYVEAGQPAERSEDSRRPFAHSVRVA